MGGFCYFRFSKLYSTCKTHQPISKKAVREHYFKQLTNRSILNTDYYSLP